MLNNESNNLLGSQQPSISFPSHSRRTSCTCTSLSILITLLLGIVVVVALAAGPLHAQCSVKWIINLPCDAVSSILADQIKNWTTEDCPGKSQKCLYALVSVGDNIVATHTTPVLRFVDDIEFVFCPAESDGCEVSGHSVSRSWYAVLDSGTNYRNMYNLMQGGGLSSTPGFSEFTSDRNCTQYSTANSLWACEPLSPHTDASEAL